MATNFSFEGLLGGINNAFGGGSSNYLDEYLTPEQRRMMQRNAMLAASAALLKAGGESTRRIGIGEALGEALQAGQAGYEKAQTGALTQMALKQKLDEAKRAAELRKRIAGVFTPQTAMPGAAPAAMQPAAPMPKIGDTYPYTYLEGQKAGTSEQRTVTQADLDAAQNYKRSTVQLPPDLLAPTAAPTAQGMPAPMNPNAAKANQYRQAAKMFEEDGQLEKAMQYQEFALKLDPQNASTGTALSKLIAERAMLPAGSPLIKPYDAAIEKESQFAPTAPRAGTLLSQLQADLAGATDSEIRSQIKARIQKEINNPPPAQNIVNINEGQKGFENVSKLSSAFKGEPIYKEYQGMQTAFNQVNTALNQETPIGDLAGATKMMKLMDEGSVVRETELALAMAAAGRMDRLKNYLNQAMTGQKLTPTQRLDFKALSNELYAAAGQAYNQKRGEYEAFGNAYQLPNLNTALGAPANVPPVMRQPSGSVTAPGTGGRLTWDPAQKKFVNR
jgi:tetratricopeptide (TPR) repeat protein